MTNKATSENSTAEIRRRCISPSITDVENSNYFTEKEARLDSGAVLIQSIFRGSKARKEQSICNSSAAIFQGFLRNKTKSRHGACKESSSISVGSSTSTYRLSTEDEERALMDQIYRRAEAQAHPDATSVCVSQYAWRLVLASEQELMFEG
jgi:hypothetical protein